MIRDLYKQGVQAANEGDKKKALDLFSQAVKLDPEFEQGWTAIGQILFDLEKKEFCFKRALSINPNNQTARQYFQQKEQEQKANEDNLDNLEDDQESLTRSEVIVPKKRGSTILALAAGLFVGLITFGIVISVMFPSIPYFIQLAIFGPKESSPQLSQMEQPPMTYYPPEDLPETWTPGPQSTMEPNQDPQMAKSISQTFSDSYYTINEAISLMNDEKYSEAILYWDQVIKNVPEYADAYYFRGICYMKLTKNQRFLEEYLDYGRKAYDDFTAAIDLNPHQGDYYSKRVDALEAIKNEQDFINDQVPYFDQILEDVLEAYALGNYYAWGTRSVGIALLNAGRCDESLDYLLRLEEERGPDADPSATINGTLAACYFCLEDYETALDYANAAIQIRMDKGHDYKDELFQKAEILISLKRNSEALEILNQLIEETPNYRGYRYYRRAYIYYMMGEPELAYDDLLIGSTMTWGKYGYRAYILGKLAQDNGDLDQALEWFQLAEATISRIGYPFMYNNALDAIQELGGERLLPTPTPSPTPEITPTPIPVIADHVYFTPTPPSDLPRTYPVNYKGTGMDYLVPGKETIFQFRPKGYHNILSITSLTIYLSMEDQGFDPSLSMSLLRMNGSGFSEPIDIHTGEAKLENVEGFVSPAGYLYLSLKNNSDYIVVINNISIKLETINEDGEVIVLGVQE